MADFTATPEQVQWAVASLGGTAAAHREAISYTADVLTVPDEIASDVEATLAAYTPGAPLPPQVPSSVTPAQAMIALHRAGLLDMVEAAVDSDPELKIWFGRALSWERQNPHVVALGEDLLGGSAEVDAMFIAAAQIAA